MKEITFKIDGMEIKRKDGMTILEAARGAGINIPTLCFHETIKPYGVCRICIVEIEVHGKKRLVASCLYPIAENLVVWTKSDIVIKIRKMLLEMMLAIAPEANILKELAEEYGVKNIRFAKEPSFCVLCGLCVRYCVEVKKKNAIGFIGRGTEREISFIPEISAKECFDCRECFSLCPTSALQATFVLDRALSHCKPSLKNTTA